MRVNSRIAAITASVLALSTYVATSFAATEYPAGYDKIVEAGKQEGGLVVFSTTDKDSVTALIAAFEAKYPGIKVDYRDLNSNAIIKQVTTPDPGASIADVVWSSSMDSAIKLAKAYGAVYRSPESVNLPVLAIWNDTAYGTTYEPVGFVYNKEGIAEGQMPKTHADLAKLIASQPEKFKGKVTLYDIEKSAVGFMLVAQDQANDTQFAENLKGITSAGSLDLQSSTSTMLKNVASGKTLIGYNILGPYAETFAKTNPTLGISYPTDYSLVVSRVSFINKDGKNNNAAKLWLDFVLSKEGQELIANQSNLPSIRDDISGDNDVEGLTKRIGTSLTPIPVDETLTETLDDPKRQEFLKIWQDTIGAAK